MAEHVDITDVATSPDASEGGQIAKMGGWVDVDDPNVPAPNPSLVELAQRLKSAVVASKEFGSLPVEIAVSKFKGIGVRESAIVEDILEDLSTALVKTGVFQLVERSQLETILVELRLQSSGLVDSDRAKKLGKLVGAKAILVGSVSDRKDCYVINVRLINTETGLVRIADSAIMPKEPQPRILRAKAIGIRGVHMNIYSGACYVYL